MASAINLRIGPVTPLDAPRYRRSIEPLIAIILDSVCGSDPQPPDPLSLPSLGVSSLDLGRLWQRGRPFFLCAP
jgi:hypothetical protein